MKRRSLGLAECAALEDRVCSESRTDRIGCALGGGAAGLAGIKQVTGAIGSRRGDKLRQAEAD
jgi:ABC-type uncharacterized transport system permease subunit